ncbi:unnamed protein product [Prorocentrum cordatum]|uniref:Uncharacterized protein n=1 Tax=Prorocentrum cordatum TaxID=2364126 RepID=A0ABN9V6P7_9DINO|nr:unnamed protein product [Polarella glacialis]
MAEDAAALELLPAAQLKRRAAVLGVSLAGCFDKREMARRLAAAAPSPPSPAAIDEPGSPLRRTQEPAVSPSPSPSPSPDLNAMSMRELKHLSKTYSVDLTGWLLK